MSEPFQSREQTPEQKPSGSAPAVKCAERSHFYLWVAALAAVVAILLHQSLFEGKGLVPADGIFNFPPWLAETNRPSDSLLGDQYLVFIPQHEFTHREFLQGRFPLWNPNLACGQPNLASIQGGLLYPINVLLLPVSPFYAAGIAAFLKLFLAGFFTMLYMRLLGAGNSGAFLSGLVFSLSGFMICWLGHPHVNCAICLPALLYLIEKSFQYGPGAAEGLTGPRAMRVWAGLAVAFGWLLLGGHPPTMIQVAFFAGIYFLFRLMGQKNSRPCSRMALAGCAAVLGFFLAAPALLPFLEYYRHSSMDASSIVMNRAGIRSPLNTMILYLFPRLSGSPAEGFEDTMLWLGIGKLMPNFVERTGYVGVLPWLFAIFAVIARRGRWTTFYGTVTVVCLLAVYGMPPFPALFEALPIVKDINPTRLVMIAGFSVAVLAGLGWDSFYQVENRRKRAWVVVGFWAVIGFILLGYCHKVAPMWKYLDADHRAFLRPQFLMMAGAALATGPLLLPSVSRHPGLRSILGLGWVAADLLVFGMGINPSMPHNSYYTTTPAIDWLERDKTDFRLLGLGMVLVPNTPELYGLKDARGYDFVTVRRYEELIDGNAGTFFFYRTATALPPTLPLLGVKYVLNFNSPPPDPSLFNLVYSNEITIYRNRQPHERVLPVFKYTVENNPATVLAKVRSGTFDPAQTLLLEQEPQNVDAGVQSGSSRNSSASVVSELPDEVNVDASLSRPGFLLLFDTWFPGWKATVNGVKTPILRADYNFRAVQLPAGKSVVRFIYEPASFYLGIALFLVGLVIVVAGFFNIPVSLATKRHT